jgi:hypothetical protein
MLCLGFWVNYFNQFTRQRLKHIYEPKNNMHGSLDLTWKSCVFGSHPKAILFAYPYHVDRFDARVYAFEGDEF